jgi:hypothetical protein
MDREPHFLDDYVEELKASGKIPSEEKAGTVWYNPYGDCFMFLSVNEGVISDRIDEYLTIYRSAIDSRAIGFQLKGINALLEEFDIDIARVRAEIERDEVKTVTLSLILLKSYGRFAPTQRRVMGYAEAVTQFGQIHEESIKASR